MLGSPESLVFLGSQAGLGRQGRQEDKARGENGVRKGHLESRAETALLALLEPPALLGPRWLRMRQVSGSPESKDPQDSRVRRESRAATVTEAPKETGARRAPRGSRASQDRGDRTAARVCPESEEWLGLRGSRVCRDREGLQDQPVVMETLDHLVPRVSLAPQDPRDLLA